MKKEEESVLPPDGSLLFKVVVATNLELSVFTGPVLYISNIGDAVEIVQAGQALVGYFGQGVWWQKAGAKKDEEVTPLDLRYVLQDSNELIIHSGDYTPVGEIVNKVRGKQPEKGQVQYHQMVAKPRDGYPGFFELKPKYTVYWKISVYPQAEDAQGGKVIKKEHAGSTLPFAEWNTQHTENTWTCKWTQRGLQPSHANVVFSRSLQLAPKQHVKLIKKDDI